MILKETRIGSRIFVIFSARINSLWLGKYFFFIFLLNSGMNHTIDSSRTLLTIQQIQFNSIGEIDDYTF